MNTTDPAKDFIEIKDANGADFEQMFQIYEEGLPASERKPREVVEGLVERQDYRVFALKAGDQVLAFLMVFISAQEEVALLEYMATSQQVRNQGLGTAMFEKAAQLAGTRPLLVEVDSERGSSADRELCLRRKNFYFRQGCRQIENLDYLMPQVGASKPPVMDLAYLWHGHTTPPAPDLIRRWLTTLYTEVYQRSVNDPSIESMMAGLED